MIVQRLFKILPENAQKDSIDPYLEEYLEPLFMVKNEDEFDLDAISTLLKEYVPECSKISSEILTKWILESRELFMNETNSENESSVNGAENDNLLNLTRMFPETCKVNVMGKSRCAFEESNDDSNRMSSSERLAVMERYGAFSSTRAPSPPSRRSTEKEGSKLRYLNGEVVDTTGKRYIEIKKDYPDMPKPVFLKAGRRYRFH